MTAETDHGNRHHPNLCPALRWKGQFIAAAAETSVHLSNDGLFWCLHSQTCIGPDGDLADPGNCSSTTRACHGTGKCRQNLFHSPAGGAAGIE
jgi:hypothetical protein